MIKPPSSCNCNSSTGSSMPEPFNVRRKQIHREMNKTDHDTAIIKPPLQQYNDPRLDHPCPSVLNNFYRQNERERKLTSINMKVSNRLHNQRTTLAEQNYRLGALLNQRPLQNNRTPYIYSKCIPCSGCLF
jgi:deoxycytidylate deaminase